MRIVIDMQGAQTQSRFRGIGRYTLSLAKAIARNKGEHDIILALNGLFPETIQPIRVAFDGLLPQENIRVWYAPHEPTRECEPHNGLNRKVAELIREAFLKNLQTDAVYVLSLFEGYIDDAVTNIGDFANFPTIVTLYDLIPLVNPEIYLKEESLYREYYLRKIEDLKKATHFFSISEFSKKEGIETLNLDAESITNISTACDPIFHKRAIADKKKQELFKRFAINKPFVMYSGGADERKNIPRLIRAFGALPKELRAKHQLLIAGKMPDGHVYEFKHIARGSGVKIKDLIFTGYVSDDELALFYNLCEVFVFPSWHEGFGLPALEAISCGAAVIGSNVSSIPEVIDDESALFDPYDEAAISQKMADTLTHEAFRKELVAHGLKQAQKFSWDDCAKRAIAAFENLSGTKKPDPFPVPSTSKPKLAFVSPLPPERTGIADYSAELLPVLAQYYDIKVIVAQAQVSDGWARQNCPIHDPEWLRNNAHLMDRVIYQFGNSPFHQHMLSLLEEIPGIVVLHDFYLSSLRAYLEEQHIIPHTWTKNLYQSHGYKAVLERHQIGNAHNARKKYPVNLDILKLAQGVIVHSKYSLQLASHWYGNKLTDNFVHIPLLRTPIVQPDHLQIRKTLGLKEHDFVVCSFGFIDFTKLNHRLLEAWLCSTLAKDYHCILVFVGENHPGDYGEGLLKSISDSGIAKRIHITGWAATSVFENYLAIADVAVQLRTQSRGETSAAVLDCMNHAVPTIVNANGSMAELSPDAVWMLPDDFENKSLTEALETLWQNKEKRLALGNRAQTIIRTQHDPQTCAKQYANAIEKFHDRGQANLHRLIKAIAKLDGMRSARPLADLATAIADSLPEHGSTKTIFVDISATCHNDLKTGIQRVVRSLIFELIHADLLGYRIEPVYFTEEGGRWHYRYARQWTLRALNVPGGWIADEVVEFCPGDSMLVADFTGDFAVFGEQSGFFAKLSNNGVKLQFIVYDILPILMPEAFPPDGFCFDGWLNTVSRVADGVICISQTVAHEYRAWLETDGPKRIRNLDIHWFHLGANMENSIPSYGLPDNAEQTLAHFAENTNFLMVGTIEPRKGYLQTLEAFTLLWAEGVNVNLIIVGKEGWKVLPDEKRRTIPDIVNKLNNHPELNQRLFWLEGISDEYLEKIYAASTCLIAASEGEGFGLPLIEAAQHQLPIIARDIPVFREVAGDHAHYFEGLDAASLANALKIWLSDYQNGNIISSQALSWLTWQESSEQLLKQLFNNLPT